ncbi:pectate lyase-like adhesive domain-containing protein [Lactococcus paracarnosus]|uniref:Bacterial Ig domain-containing protein n=1 Tax=Pseudolactococcus paracarnosus TaxID=2749962 RepID=A0ABT0AJ19_9LACT|nr:pectate lyase-like adhesive domain-containing protein [Lactococcus paracarnosus]MCJ1976535.1 hypothetical protein [Lactococcus paracarnosus]MCJ1982674.1 hypothetical protein [Lactococcus paracarnosus]MCJ1997710.1 hypothetical protein [Lactococcus paracarnosus]
MKKRLFIGLCGIALAAMSAGTLHAHATTKTPVKTATQALKSGQEVTVSSFNELSDALKDVSVTNIKVGGNITFDSSILDIPQRSVTIDGQGHQLKMGGNHITGATGTTAASFTIKNTTITNVSNTGQPIEKFFVTTSENWSVDIAGGIDYTGERFLEVQNSAVTFSGKNTIHTSEENAWVRTLTFAVDSEYTATAATSGQFSAFYFNGNLVDGKASGKVTADKNAKVTITISPDNDNDYYYPAFYDKVDRIDVNEGATLNITAAGHALQFIPRSDYAETPSVNVADGGILHLVGHGGGKYATVKFEQANAKLTANPGASVYIEGKSDNVIETAKDSVISVTNADYDFRNALAGGHIFNAKTTRLSLNQVTLNTWNKTGGDYKDEPTHAWDELSLGTIIDGNASSNTTSTNTDAQSIFQTSDYGRISGEKEKQKIDSPVLNPITDKDTQLTGIGIPGDTVIITVDGKELGRVVVGADGKWVLPISPTLAEGKTVIATQTDGTLVSDPVQQVVTHLAAETKNYFALGYWQDYGLVIEGQMDNADWDLSDSTKITKYVNLVSDDNTVALKVDAANTNWFGSAVRYNGYQAVFKNEELTALPNGTYKVQIGTKGNGIDALQDLQATNTNGETLKTTPYRSEFDKIDTQTISGKTFTTSIKDNVCYLTIS